MARKSCFLTFIWTLFQCATLTNVHKKQLVCSVTLYWIEILDRTWNYTDYLKWSLPSLLLNCYTRLLAAFRKIKLNIKTQSCLWDSDYFHVCLQKNNTGIIQPSTPSRLLCGCLPPVSLLCSWIPVSEMAPNHMPASYFSPSRWESDDSKPCKYNEVSILWLLVGIWLHLISRKWGETVKKKQKKIRKHVCVAVCVESRAIPR